MFVVRIARVADFKLSCFFDEGIHEFVGHGLIDDKPFRVHAALANVREARFDRGLGCNANVGIRQNDEWIRST